MTCMHCGFRMGEGEHRCGRCGRRPDDTLTPVGHPAVRGALATQIQPDTMDAPPDGSRGTGELQRPLLVNAVQRRLFQDQGDNVIPFPTPRKSGKTGKRGSRRTHSVSEDQGELFLPQATAKRMLDTQVEAKVNCDVPVAARLHRVIAAALDWSMVLIGYGLFLLMFRLAGGEILLTRPNKLIFVGAFALVAFAYGAVWAIANSETAGMRWTGLRLVDFDGYPPDLKERVLRFAGSCLSVCTVLGLLWSVGDEEALTWQDHISGTFPTPLAAQNQVFQRR